MAAGSRGDIELRIRAVLEGGGTLREAREELAKMVAGEKAIQAQLRETIKLYKEEAEAAKQAAGASSGARGGAGASGQQTLFGLRPYELQNLSYQINDIFTQLASGAHLGQVAAQQGGQIFQLWGKNIFAIIPYLPQLAAGIGAVTLAVKVFQDTLRQNAALREFTSLLQISGNGADYSAPRLVALQREITKLGLSWEEAGKMIRSAIPQGIQQGAIPQIAQIARDIAIPENQDPTKVFEGIAEALRAGMPGIIRWNEEVGHLNDEQIQLIRNLDQTKGRQAAFQAFLDALSKNTQGAATNAGLFTKETVALTTAWNEFIHAMSDTAAIQFAIDLIKNLLGAVTGLLKALKELVEFYDTSPNLKIVLHALNPKAFLQEGVDAAVDSAERAMGITPLRERVLQYGPPIPPGMARDPNNTGWEDRAREQSQGVSFVNKLAVDTDELKRGMAALQEATLSAGLPKGSRVQVISTERPGATVAGTGAPSEHGAGRAIDTVILDADGNPIPGSMGRKPRGTDTTGLYAKLDAAFDAYMQQNFPGVPYAVGSRFSTNPDPGHYSIGAGHEETAQAQREGRSGAGGAVTAAPPEDIDKSRELLAVDQRRLDIQFDLNGQASRAAVIRNAELEADQQGLTAADKTEKVRRAALQFDVQRAETLRKFQQDLANQRIEDGKHSAEIDAAGQAARQKAIADSKGFLTLEQANTAEMQGREEARKKFAAAERVDEQQRQHDAAVDEKARQAGLKETTSLQSLLDANAKRRENEHLKFLKDQADATGRHLTLTEDPARNARIAAAEDANTTVDFYQRQLQALTQQRQELVSAANASVTAGGMTVTEGQDAIKRAFEATTPAIDAATAAFEEFLTTTKDIDPTRVDTLLAKVKQMRVEAQYIDPLWKTIRDTFDQSFASGLSTAFTTISDAIGGLITRTKSWGDALKEIRNAAMSFFADLLKAIAQAIIKFEAMRIASAMGFGAPGAGGAGGSLLGSIFGSGAGSIFGSQGPLFGTAADASIAAGGPPLALAVAHGGGIVGALNSYRSGSAGWFAGATRYHNGGLVGLAPDEQAAILRNHEEVLTPSNPRHIANQMRGAGGGIAIRNVLVQNEADIPAAMAGAHGERVVMAHIQKNIATVRQQVK